MRRILLGRLGVAIAVVLGAGVVSFHASGAGVDMPTPDNFRLTVPYPEPKNEAEQAANWRALDRWANTAPFYEEVIGLIGQQSSSPLTLEDPADEPLGDDNPPRVEFHKYDDADRTNVVVSLWVDTYGGSDSPVMPFMWSLRFEGQTNSYDEIHEITPYAALTDDEGAAHVGLFAKNVLGGIPAGVYTVTMYVTIFGSGSITIAQESTIAGFTLQEALPSSTRT